MRLRPIGSIWNKDAWQWDVGMSPHFGWMGCAVALIATVAFAAPALTAREKRGAALLERMCAPCHAVGRTGSSPHRQAPPFRTLSNRLSIESLEDTLAEGIISGHPDMPAFKFGAADVGAVIAYLRVIQEP
jgi:mono/diheme cytochrome c family protein